MGEVRQGACTGPWSDAISGYEGALMARTRLVCSAGVVCEHWAGTHYCHFLQTELWSAALSVSAADPWGSGREDLFAGGFLKGRNRDEGSETKRVTSSHQLNILFLFVPPVETDHRAESQFVMHHHGQLVADTQIMLIELNFSQFF